MHISVSPLILGAGALVFAALALWHFLARCLTFTLLIASRYICLILTFSLEIVSALATTVYSLVFMLHYTTLLPYTSWTDVFPRGTQFPTISSRRRCTMYDAVWWVTPLSPFTLPTILCRPIEPVRTLSRPLSLAFFPRKKTIEKVHFDRVDLIRRPTALPSCWQVVPSCDFVSTCLMTFEFEVFDPVEEKVLSNLRQCSPRSSFRTPFPAP
ncbi:hypothetical protein C8R45DRAFT_1099370 [Mycena sanguinolenta]|nr:hypothetical protein C8R45DRAFT_1099370 [Mycena sanguinolenta]